jgi:predicted transcriptional regulator
MNFPGGRDIRQRRELLGLSQKAFAQKLNALKIRMRQPYLSKIESDSADPPFSVMKAIFSALAQLENQKSVETIGMRLRPRLAVADSSETVLDAARKMKRNGFSQLPVYYK